MTRGGTLLENGIVREMVSERRWMRIEEETREDDMN